MVIQLSCNDYAWPALSHQTVLAVIADLGFAAVDVGVFGEATHVTLPLVREDPPRRGEETRQLAARAGLSVADVFLTSSMQLERLTPTSRHPGDQAELRRIFDDITAFAVAAGSPGVTLLPGVIEAGWTLDEALTLSAEGLLPLVEMGSSRGLGVSVEPHVGSCVETPDATLELVTRCPGLSLTLDPSHYAFSGWKADSLTPLVEHTRHVQVRPGGPGVMQCKVPDNQIDLRRLVADLVAVGYEGFVASEFVWMEKWGCDETDNTAESARLAALLRELLAEVGG